MGAIKVEPRIETERLVLRPPAPSDAAGLVCLINDIEIARMTTRIPHPYGLADAEAFLAGQGDIDAARDRSLQIETRDGRMIGVVGAHARDEPFPEIGYWIARTHWGRGYATEAAMAIRDWAVKAFACRALVAGHFADNPASGRVLVKCGFLYTGEVRQRFSVARGAAAATRMMIWLA